MAAYPICHKIIKAVRVRPEVRYGYLSLLVASQFGCLYIGAKLPVTDKLGITHWLEVRVLVITYAIVARPAKKVWTTSAADESTVMFAVRPGSRLPQLSPIPIS